MSKFEKSKSSKYLKAPKSNMASEGETTGQARAALKNHNPKRCTGPHRYMVLRRRCRNAKYCLTILYRTALLLIKFISESSVVGHINPYVFFVTSSIRLYALQFQLFYLHCVYVLTSNLLLTPKAIDCIHKNDDHRSYPAIWKLHIRIRNMIYQLHANKPMSSGSILVLVTTFEMTCCSIYSTPLKSLLNPLPTHWQPTARKSESEMGQDWEDSIISRRKSENDGILL